MRKQLKQFGTYYWDGPTLRLNYMIEGQRQRPKFAVLRTGSAAEKRNLEQEARHKLNEINIAIRGGTLFDTTGYPTYKQMALWYWEKFQSLKEYVKHSRQCYVTDYTKLKFGIEYFGDRSGATLKREDIKNFRMHLRSYGNSDKVKRKWSNAYINRIIATVGQVYSHCISQEFWIFDTAPMEEKIRYGNIGLCVKIDNPIKGLPKLTEDPKKPIVPTIAQFQKLLGALRPAFRDMAIVGVHTGLRRRNVVELKLTEIDFEIGELLIDTHKGGTPASRKRLHKEALDVVLARREYIRKNKIDTEYIFCKPDGDCYHDFYIHWRAACKEAGIPGFWFEHLRPTYGSWRVEEGAQLPLLQRALDHSTPTTTGRFYNKTSQATSELLKKQRSVLEPVLVGAGPDPDKNPDKILTKLVPASFINVHNSNLN